MSLRDEKQKSMNRDRLTVTATPWEAVLPFDTAVFTLTLYKAIEVWKSGPSTLFEVLVRDGEL